MVPGRGRRGARMVEVPLVVTVPDGRAMRFVVPSPM
jgi:hypothetical protein